MKLQINHQYQLIDLASPQGLPGHPPQLRLTEILEYRGQWVIVGEKLLHQQHIFIHGFETIPVSLACCVVLPNDIPGNVHRLSTALNGRELALRDIDGTLLPIVNWAARLGSLWWSDGAIKTRDELVKRALKVVDLYHEWRINGEWPKWFVEAKNKRHSELYAARN